jgi:TonB family protein
MPATCWPYSTQAVVQPKQNLSLSWQLGGLRSRAVAVDFEPGKRPTLPLFISLLVTYPMKKRVYLTLLYLSSCAAAQAQIANAPAQMVVPRASDGNGRGVDTTKVYDVVERMPALPLGGGSRAIVQALQQAVGWPAPGKETERVVVEFIVDRTGHARQARLLKAASPAVDAAVLTAVSKLPAFTPGNQKGEAVYVRFRVPVLVSPRF